MPLAAASLQTSVRPCASAARPRGPTHQPAPAPPLPRRRLLSVAVPLLFLPWRGCDQGGNYSTGKGISQAAVKL